jgi:hypothetical protein
MNKEDIIRMARLAALWEKQSHGYALTPEAKTAAELRRLHALNGELLEALKAVTAAPDLSTYGLALHNARAAIAKAEGKV